MHSKCNALESSRNHCLLTPAKEKLSSVKPVAGARKVGDRCPRALSAAPTPPYCQQAGQVFPTSAHHPTGYGRKMASCQLEYLALSLFTGSVSVSSTMVMTPKEQLPLVLRGCVNVISQSPPQDPPPTPGSSV